nr:hypothetical protein [uncultured Roseateles sp.]
MSQEKETCELLWILYSDANARFNTLIEECAHLQDTILGLVDDHALVKKVIAETKATNRDLDGFGRDVVCNARIHDDYYRISVRDRSFLSLWNLLGGLITGLNKNQQTHQSSYQIAVRQLVMAQRRSESLDESIYWYVAQRGYLLSTVFLHYTSQLEHAHEKLIQLLENQAGTLPNPILLRRWNSALYGEFLSEYSRHINWETQQLVKRLNKSESKSSKGEMDEGGQSITHTWTHYPTSLASYFDVRLDFSDAQTGKTNGKVLKRFASIRSSYFYLEQPILFPLLYHECAHLNFPSKAAVESDHRSFFGSRVAACESLRLLKFPTQPPTTYENFWEHFTEEVWADALSIALGGRAYLMALTLQLVALPGHKEFSHFKIDDDELFPLDELGTPQGRKYEIHYPGLDMPFFWEARLGIACRLLEKIEKPNESSDASTAPVGNAVLLLIEKWWESGAHAYRKDGTSVEHESYWRYRKELNRWVERTILNYLEPAIEDLAKYSKVCTTYEISSKSARSAIENVVNLYRAQFFVGREALGVFRLQDNHRLESVVVDARWQIAVDVCESMALQQEYENWIKAFATWVRSDGSFAFRVALEYFRIKFSIVDALADKLELALESREIKLLNDFVIAKGFLHSEKFQIDGYLSDDRKQIVRLLRRRGITNADPTLHGQPADGRFWTIKKQLDFQADRAMEEVAALSPKNGMAIGTLLLGVVRPSEFAEPRPGVEQGYLGCMTRVKEYFVQASSEKSSHAAGRVAGRKGYLSNMPNYQSTFVKMIGEYQFLAYTEDATPVEREAHPDGGAPRLLLKPRLVLHVGGMPLSMAIEDGEEMWARVALIRFKYKWQWVELLKTLNTGNLQKIKHFTMFLSSAWEDAILLTWHTAAEDLWDLDVLGFRMGSDNGIDIQSNYIVPKSAYSKICTPIKPKISDSWVDEMSEWTEHAKVASRIYSRSGRYDYTVVWKDSSDMSLPQYHGCPTGVASMPSHLWQQVTGMMTSFEKLDFPGVGKTDESNYKMVTHFAVKDRLDLGASRI